ncbi:MAG TPA: adenylate/guanylate cyclase domain-containing protein, partial [Gammaproteobacteria bacterium]
MNIEQWLDGLGLAQYAPAFLANDIDAALLPTLDDDDLRELGIASLGHRKRLLAAIAALAEHRPAPARAKPASRQEAERRQLTLLFCDLVGSTALSARLDPEEMGTLIRGYHEVATARIEAWGGQVAKYLGDGVLAYFGWPQAREDDAERAVHAGLELVSAVAALTDPDGSQLAARVGIATGLVLVGEVIGHGSAQEESVVGETPNLAARLQALAVPGTVLIGQTTRRLLGDLFELSELGQHALKGFAVAQPVWRVERAGSDADRFSALHGARMAPLVGREHELGLLLDRLERARDGEGHVVLLSGEPGIGKSRLVQALREQLADSEFTVLGHYGSPYHRNRALHPIIGLLERAAGIDRAAPVAEQL